MLDFFTRQKPKIQAFLIERLDRKSRELERVNRWGPDACRRLRDFACRGKMIRGGLTVLGTLLFKGSPFRASIESAGAIELLQSALLIHDDIMDQDAMRRGRPAVFAQYAQLGESKGVAGSRHYGESLGMCVGDIAFFLAMEIFSVLHVPLIVRQQIIGLCSREITYTCAAQMQDVHWGSANERVSDAEIERLYVYKTGRYTFSLPLMIGGILTRQSPATLHRLEAIGEKMGVIFQIRDDELGLFGKAEEIGKPVGSDVREGKKTLFYNHLFERADSAEKDRLGHIFGNPELDFHDLQYVRKLVRDLGIQETLNDRVFGLAKEAQKLAVALRTARGEYRQILLKLIRYNVMRSA